MAILLAFVPIYLANVAFSKRFGASDDSKSAFGLNLLGAMLGGCLEYLALLTGYRNLLLVVAALYLWRSCWRRGRGWSRSDAVRGPASRRRQTRPSAVQAEAVISNGAGGSSVAHCAASSARCC